uniref:Peptidase S1 domain-containing protein n=1 Tax=Heliothis virescens TaxID=7102 RepID=A0A2A4JL27_HELVI
MIQITSIVFMISYISVIESLKPKVVDGVKASIKDFPHSVFIGVNCAEADGNKVGWICGASILNVRVVLSAAHCMYGCTSDSVFSVFVGHANRKNGIHSSAHSFLFHEDYSSMKVDNDIGLIRLRTPLTLNKRVMKVALMRKPPYYEKALIAGWGMTNEYTEAIGNDLMYIEQYVWKGDSCRQLINNQPKGTICASSGNPNSYSSRCRRQVNLVSSLRTVVFCFLMLVITNAICCSCNKISPRPVNWFTSLVYTAVSCRKMGFWVCGSSIVNERVLLTAAHCMENCLKHYTVMVSVGHKSQDQGQSRSASNFYIHSKYDSPSISNDIALILLKKDLKFGRSVQRVALMRIPPNDQIAEVAGWGIVDVETGELAKNLQYIKKRLIKTSVCQDRTKSLPEGTICADSYESEPYITEGRAKGQASTVSDFYVHEEHNTDSSCSDIALARLKTDMQLGNLVQRVAVLRRPPNVKVAELAGWGLINEQVAVNAKTLQKTKQIIIKRPECQRRMKNIPQGAFCGDSMDGHSFASGLLGFIACEKKPMIVDGDVARIEDFPHSALMSIQCKFRYGERAIFQCGASILNHRITMSAAHCLVDCGPGSRASISVGKNTIGGQKTLVKRYVIHEHYDGWEVINDIALMNLRTALNFGIKVQRVALMANPPYNEKAIVAGWGLVNEETLEESPYLHYVDQYVWTAKDCKVMLGRAAAGTLCASSRNITSFASKGDSGSALVVRGYIQIGIVSYKVPRVSRSLVVYTDTGLLGFIACEKKPMIVDGTAARIEDFPHSALVGIRCNFQYGERRYFQCGASILNQRIAMSAAHCLAECAPGSTASISVGKNTIGGQVASVKSYIMHENYHGPPDTKNDIVLMYLKTSLNFGIKVKRVALMANPPYKEKATVAGWGLVNEVTLEKSPYLHHIDQYVRTAKECKAMLGQIPAGSLCASSGNIEAYASSLLGFIAYEKKPMIVDGTAARIEDFPHSALMGIRCNFRYGDRRYFQCGASILNQRIAMSAAHCLAECAPGSTASISVGKNTIGGQVASVKSYIMHENYHGPPDTKNDIVLMYLKTPLNFGIKVKRVALMANPPYKEKATVAGWGLVNEVTLEKSPYLHYIDQYVRTAKECKAMLGQIPAGSLCASSGNIEAYASSLLGFIAYEKKPMIVDGTAARIEDFPHSALMGIRCNFRYGDRRYFQCGASILNQRIAMSAAHCLAECAPGSTASISVGKNTIGGQVASVKSYIMHENYHGPPDTKNDIVLMYLKTPLNFGIKVKRVALMANPPYKEKATVAGWGLVNEVTLEKSPYLHYIDQYVRTAKECKAMLGQIPAGSLCASSGNIEAYASRGDSGSALVVRGYIQIGIVSYKIPDISRSLVVYTDTGLLGFIACEKKPMIVDGTVARIEDFPHSALMGIQCKFRYGERIIFQCGASILNHRIAMSAAHCLAKCGPGSTASISVGQNTIGVQMASVDRYVIHEHYHGSPGLINDIALMYLKTSLNFGIKVQRVALMANPPYKEKATVAGWGLVNEEPLKKSPYLHYVDQYVRTAKECKAILGEVPAGTLCASSGNIKSYASRGDSGSALVVRGYIQIGIVSFRDPSISRSLVVYTDTGLLGFIACEKKTMIVDGTVAKIEDFPHSALMGIQCKSRYGERIIFQCGASILNHRIAMSAAHCMANCEPGSRASISVGKNTIGGQVASVKRYVIHEHYHGSLFYNDIVVMNLRTALDFGIKVKRVALMANPPYNEKAIVAGWGLVNEVTLEKSPYLHYVDQYVRTAKDCKAILGEVPAGTFCANSRNIKSYASSGDSGSALVVRGYIQIGIVSFKDPSISRSLVVYTDIGYFYDWITHHTKMLYCA